jgi:hypothetical protein
VRNEPDLPAHPDRPRRRRRLPRRLDDVPAAEDRGVPPPAPAASTAPAKQPGNTAQSAPARPSRPPRTRRPPPESAAKARAGEAAEPAATAAPGAATTTAAPKPAPTAAQKLGVDADALATLPTGVRKEIEARKIVVLGFFNRDALDDRATRKQLDKVWTFHGRASVHTAPISDVQRYQVITRGVDVAQSPSIVVIDRDRKAQLLTGFVDHVAIEQAVMDAMRRSGMPIVKSHYLRQVNALCGSYSNAPRGFAGRAEPLRRAPRGPARPARIPLVQGGHRARRPERRRRRRQAVRDAGAPARHAGLRLRLGLSPTLAA